MRGVIENLVRFVLLTIVQIGILNNVDIGGFLCPYLYVVCILMLPFNCSGPLMILLSFLLGLTIDFFSGTLGLHAASTVVLGALYPIVVGALYNRRDIPPSTVLDLKWCGANKYISMVSMLVISHHLVLYFLDAFTFQHFFFTFSHALLNAVITIVIIMLYQVLLRSGRDKSWKR